MAKLIWADKAVLDLERIYDFIAADSPLYARAQINRITRAVERLQSFPESGRALPELPQFPHKELITGSYRLIYRYDQDSATIFIITIVHSARILQESSLT
jgi:toxin ParE1/3/4